MPQVHPWAVRLPFEDDSSDREDEDEDGGEGEEEEDGAGSGGGVGGEAEGQSPWGGVWSLGAQPMEEDWPGAAATPKIFSPSSASNMGRHCVHLLTSLIQSVESPHEPIKQNSRLFMDGLLRHFAFVNVTSGGARKVHSACDANQVACSFFLV